MNLEDTVLFKGLDYTVHGKKAFIKEILSFKEVQEEYMEALKKPDVIELLGFSERMVSLDNKHHSLSLNEDDLVKIFDLLFAGRIKYFLKENSLSCKERFIYVSLLEPMLNSESSLSFRIDHLLIYGIINQEKCRNRLKELWFDHPEYYSYYLDNLKSNEIFESSIKATLIPYSRMLTAMLDIMRKDHSQFIYQEFIKLVILGYPLVRKYLKKNNRVDANVLRDIVSKDLDNDENPFLYNVCTVAAAVVLADEMVIPYKYDYTLLIMLDQLKKYEEVFLSDAESIMKELFPDDDANIKSNENFLANFKTEYGTLSSTAELYMPTTMETGDPAPQSDMVMELMQKHGVNVRKLAHYNLTNAEINYILGLMPTWNKRNYWYALHISSLCKYISELEKEVILLMENGSRVKEHSYEKEKEILSLEKKYLDREKLFIQKTIENLKNENSSLNHEISSLLAEKELLIKSHEVETKDLNDLRNYVYLLSTNAFENETSEQDVCDYSFWMDKKVVVIGGHDNWQSKLKKEFPNWTYLNAENKSFSTTAIKDKDYVICNTEVLSHATYYRLMSVKEKDQKLFFVRSNNFSLVMKELMMQLNAS